MLKYILSISEFGLNVLRVEFESESIEIEVNDFYKDLSNFTTLYDKINEYIQFIPIYYQKEIFDIFKRVVDSEYKQNYSNINYIHKLENKIARVVELFNYNNFKMWFKSNMNNLYIPEDIKDEFIYDSDMTTIEEKTYIKSQYINYVALIIFIRAISPLYIDYYNYIKNITNHCYYKLFLLFIKSEIYVSPEIDKLKEYIEANHLTLIGNTKHDHLILGAGLSDDDIVDYLISEIIFNKLLTIDFFNKKCNIISYTFQTIRYKGSFITSESFNIKSKTAGADPTKEDISYFEDYRKTSSIPIGTVVEIQHALTDINKLITYLGYGNFDYNLYQQELSNLNIFMENRIDKIQIYLLGWFLNKFINPRALYYIEYKKLVELILFAKVVLLNNNHTFIGMLLSSYKTNNSVYINIVMKNILNKTLIRRIFPYYSFIMEDEKISIVEKTITEISNEIINHVWVPVGTEDQVNKVKNTQGYLSIPSDLNNVICEYIEFVNT